MTLKVLEAFLTSIILANPQITDLSAKDVLCMAENIYHEARGEPIVGQRAVAHVTLNRVADGRWPDTVCRVVYERQQFSWTLIRPSVTEPAAFETAVVVAVNAMAGITPDPTDGATHYFAHEVVTPRWSRSFETVAVIGAHKFQR